MSNIPPEIHFTAKTWVFSDYPDGTYSIGYLQGPTTSEYRMVCAVGSNGIYKYDGTKWALSIDSNGQDPRMKWP